MALHLRSYSHHPGAKAGDPSTQYLVRGRHHPEHHAIANNFVDLDNFYDTAEVSYDGWAWSTSALAPDIVIRQTAVNYCFRGGTAYESEGDLRGVNLNYRSATLAANVLPGTVDTAAPDGPNNALNGGYLWSTALRSGLSVREYGADGDTVGSAVAWPASIGVQQTNPSFAVLNNSNDYDVHFRAYDLTENDTYRYQEWNYDVFTRLGGNLPALSILRLPKDHTGSYSSNPAVVNYTPEAEVADNDFAVGKIIQESRTARPIKPTLWFSSSKTTHRMGAIMLTRTAALPLSLVLTSNWAPLFPPSTTPSTSSAPSSGFLTSRPTTSPMLCLSLWLTCLILPSTRVTGRLPQQLLPSCMAPSWRTKAAQSFLLAPPAWSSRNPLTVATTGPRSPRASILLRLTMSIRLFTTIIWRGLKGDVVYPGDSSRAETRLRYKEALKKRNTKTTDPDDE